MGEKYGYVRVSGRDQNVARQRAAMRAEGIRRDRVHVDRMSGKDFQRPEYRRLLDRLKPGDLLCVTSIDRLGRNYEEIRRQWAFLTNVKQVDIQVLDTRCAKDLLGNFVADLVLQVLSFVAENERLNIRKRQAEGIRAAQQRGVRFGRPSEPLPKGFKELCALWRQGKITLAEAARRGGMARSSFRYRARALERKMK